MCVGGSLKCWIHHLLPVAQTLAPNDDITCIQEILASFLYLNWGWTCFEITESVWITDMLFSCLGDQYALKMRLVDHVYDDQVIDLLTVKIILPEGARSVFEANPQSVIVTTECCITVCWLSQSCPNQKHPRGHTLQNWSHAKPAALYISGYLWPSSTGCHQEQPGGASHSGRCGKTIHLNIFKRLLWPAYCLGISRRLKVNWTSLLSEMSKSQFAFLEKPAEG